MSDPRRLKRRAQLHLEVIYGDEPSPVKVYTYADAEQVRGLPDDVLKHSLTQELNCTALKPGAGIYQTYASFSYSDPSALSDFDYGNTLVEVTLPYCLHIPNYHEVSLGEQGGDLRARVTFTKIWTSVAEAEGKKSDPVDFFAEDRITYFKDSVFLSPQFPVKPEEGWQQRFTGRNIERMKDQHGTFRYTKLLIELDSGVSKDALSQSRVDKPLSEVRETALIIVNKVLDAYRSVTRHTFVRRLGVLNINMIYFIAHNQGFYLMSPGFGIQTAMINRSRQEIARISSILKHSQQPDLYELLLLDARDSLDNRDHKPAVIEAFQALETFLERDLVERFKANGIAEAEYRAVLKRQWQTKARLTSVIKSLTGTSIVTADRALWDRWCTSYDKTRNSVVHESREPSGAEVKEAIDTNEALISWLRSV